MTETKPVPFPFGAFKKGSLYRFYLDADGIPERTSQYRIKKLFGARHYAQWLSRAEVTKFIKRYGCPRGYYIPREEQDTPKQSRNIFL